MLRNAPSCRRLLFVASCPTVVCHHEPTSSNYRRVHHHFEYFVRWTKLTKTRHCCDVKLPTSGFSPSPFCGACRHSFMQAHLALHTMRRRHKQNNCGFFAFTVIRPPLDWLLSLYDDICHRRLRGHMDTCPQRVSGRICLPVQSGAGISAAVLR